MKNLFKLLVLPLFILLYASDHLDAQSKVPKEDSAKKAKAEIEKAQETASQSLFLDYVKNLKEQNGKDIESQNRRIDEYLKGGQNKLDFYLAFLGIFLTVIFGLSLFFSFSFRKQAKEQMAEMKLEITEKKNDVLEYYNSLKLRLESAESILLKIEETTQKARSHEEEYKRTLGQIKNYDPEKSLTEVNKKFLEETISKSKEELAKSGLESLKNLYYANALKAHDAAKFEDAVRLFTTYLDIFEGDAIVYHRRGRSYDFLEKDKEAFEDYNRAILCDPNYSWAYNNRGLLFVKMGEQLKAMADYNKAIELDPEVTRAYTNRGLLYYDQDRLEESLNDYNTVIKLDPKDDNAYSVRGNLFNKMNDQKKAITDFTKAIELNPSNAVAYTNRGYSYDLLGQPNNAIRDWDKAIEIDQTDPTPYYNRYLHYKNKGDKSNANSNLDILKKLDPNTYSVIPPL